MRSWSGAKMERIDAALGAQLASLFRGFPHKGSQPPVTGAEMALGADAALESFFQPVLASL